MSGSSGCREQVRQRKVDSPDHYSAVGSILPPKDDSSSMSRTMPGSERRHLLPSMPEDDIEPPRTWRDCIPTGRAFAFPVVALHLALGTAVWQQLMVPGSSIGDAFYFAVETFLTIGYGDITPATETAKTFFILYTVLSLIVQLTVLSTFVSSTLSMSPELNAGPAQAPGGASQATSILLSQGDHDHEVFDISSNQYNKESDGSDDGTERLKAFFKVKPRIIRAVQGLILLFGLITVGAVMLKFTSADTNMNKTLTWLDCWYWSVTTISTVGYGDIAPTEYRPLFACFFLVAVVLFASLLGETVALVTELGNYRRLSALFENGLGPEALAKMDSYQGDGRVSRVEFLMFILQHLEIADRGEMEHILTLFESCDNNGDGVLDLQDVKSRMSRRSRIAASARQGGAQSSFSRAAAAAVAATQQDSSSRV